MPKELNPVSPDSWEAMEDPLATAIGIVSDILADVTSHNDFERRKLAYYAVATHFMRDFGTFPGLAIYGPSGSGKTATLFVLELLCRKVNRVTSTAITPAALKDAAIESNGGTLMIEEGEEVSAKQLEEILLLRYDKSSAWVTKMVPAPSGGWMQEKQAAFGATIMHRDHLFKKPQLQRRMIPVKTSLDIGKKYADYHTIDRRCEEEIKKFRVIVVPGAAHTSLPEVFNPSKDISQGIFDCYRPLVAIARYLEDADFYPQLVEEMKVATDRLKEDVSDTDTASILRVIIMLVNEKTEGKYKPGIIAVDNARIQRLLHDEYGPDNPATLLSRVQRNRIIRYDFKFTIKGAGGKHQLRLSIAQLIEVCDANDVQDELLEKWRKEIKPDESVTHDSEDKK